MMMATKWDLTAHDRNNQLVLVVEVKNILDATPQWAAQLRRNILAHGTFPNAPYFLIVFPDRLYLWTNTSLNLDLIQPTYTVDARPIFRRYFEQAGITADKVSGQSFELIVASWLSELIHKTRNELDKSEQWLIDSGLYDAMIGASLDREVSV
jgi:hypothetical protein